MFTSVEKYLTTLLKRLEDLMGMKLKNYSSLMEADYHPELEATPVLGDNEHSIYRMLSDQHSGRSPWEEQTLHLWCLQWLDSQQCQRRVTCWPCINCTVTKKGSEDSGLHKHVRTRGAGVAGAISWSHRGSGQEAESEPQRNGSGRICIC